MDEKSSCFKAPFHPDLVNFKGMDENFAALRPKPLEIFIHFNANRPERVKAGAELPSAGAGRYRLGASGSFGGTGFHPFPPKSTETGEKINFAFGFFHPFRPFLLKRMKKSEVLAAVFHPKTAKKVKKDESPPAICPDITDFFHPFFLIQDFRVKAGAELPSASADRYRLGAPGSTGGTGFHPFSTKSHETGEKINFTFGFFHPFRPFLLKRMKKSEVLAAVFHPKTAKKVKKDESPPAICPDITDFFHPFFLIQDFRVKAGAELPSASAGRELPAALAAPAFTPFHLNPPKRVKK